MRLIDADVLIDEIKKDTQKVIKQDDKVGSFWLGYAAGLVIKQPTIQSALDPETLIRTIETGITATNSSDAYSLGMRNGMRWCKSLIDGAEPKFENDVMSVDDGKELPTIQPEPQWIPVSERLPEIGKYVLCYLKSRRYFGHYRVCIYRAANKYINHPYFDFNENGFPDVIAWMPLPEPYKPNNK